MYGSVDPRLGPPQPPLESVRDLGDVAARLAPSRASLQQIGQRFSAIEKEVADTAKKVFSLQDLPVLILPWFLFSMTMLPIAVMDESLLGYLSLLSCVLLSMGFIIFSMGTSWVMLAWICLAATTLGEAIGQYDRAGHMYLKDIYRNSRASSYHNVLPTQNPEALKDGIFFTFSDDSLVDFTRSVGYRQDKMWCVAPIVNSDAPRKMGFFAVGYGCCRERGFFDCGDIWNSSKHSALLELDEYNQAMYLAAAKMAAQTYGFELAEEPLFVRWDEYPGKALQHLSNKAIVIAVTSLLLCLIAVPISLVVLNTMGLHLTNRDEPVVQEMIFGFEWHRKKYSNQLMLDLMNHRSYWSGIVIFDYAFHIANKHIFLGPLFCHPAHPFSKKERLAVMIINVLLIIFPVSAMTAKFGKDSMVRTILVAVLVTIPRNLLKFYLVDLSMEAEEMELEGPADNKAKVRAVQRYEIIFLTGAIVVSIGTGVLCSLYIKAHTDKTLIHVLAENTDGLGFGFILEFLFDLVLPYYTGPEKEEQFVMGFFGRWYLEYSDFHSGKSKPGKMEPLQPMVQPAAAVAPPIQPPGGSAQELLSLRRRD
mmetsp:Transcript_63455/g.147874  ORF Transcript_63455/g.147874 Transcript_63455/m.147874 type:complete len:591 (-) Transcript_63455:94-1866(-)